MAYSKNYQTKEEAMKKKPSKKSNSMSEYDSHRQQNVLLEDIRKKVETVAEGHSILNQKIDRIDAKLEEHDKRFDRIEMVLTDTNTRVKKLEQKVDTVTTDHEQRIQKLESVR